ncbi:helix-turn-helix domain-containing protein [Frankia sp. Cj3]|uniref:helix-turn-helix domain-containing protein n=1 Tax=Frankia sp. Cj3 TaxID=2880976 RepID=UPI001EF47478|nr:helix-turn-helix transcriptional regulator [Frankia sp. Cj3]
MDDENRRSPVYTARGAIAGEDWQAVADAVNQRMAARRIGQQKLADTSGVSVSTVRQVQHGAHGRRVQNATLSAIAHALGWPDDHLIQILVSNHTSAASADTIDQEILAGIGRIEQRLDDINHRLAAVEKRVTAGTTNR